MTGLAKIAKTYGGIVINGKPMVWDHVADKAVPQKEMQIGSDRWRASEKVRLRRSFGFDKTGKVE